MSTIEVTITHDELIRDLKKVHVQEPVEHAFARYVRHRLKDAGVPVKMRIASTIIEIEDGAGDLYWRHDQIEESAYYRYTPKEQP
jgi:hypothetical protein